MSHRYECVLESLFFVEIVLTFTYISLPRWDQNSVRNELPSLFSSFDKYKAVAVVEPAWYERISIMAHRDDSLMWIQFRNGIELSTFEVFRELFNLDKCVVVYIHAIQYKCTNKPGIGIKGAFNGNEIRELLCTTTRQDVFLSTTISWCGKSVVSTNAWSDD